MTYDDLIEGLKERGFQYTEDICNRGGCHYDEMHFILVTDGLIIYSNFWDWNACAGKYSSLVGGLYEIWCFDYSPVYDPNTKEFSFAELDFIMKDLYGKEKNKQ